MTDSEKGFWFWVFVVMGLALLFKFFSMVYEFIKMLAGVR